MEALVTAVSPIVVTWLTQHLKKFKAIDLSKNKKVIVRTVVAVLAFGAALGTSIISGQPVDPVAIETLVKTVFIAGSTLLPYKYGQE